MQCSSKDVQNATRRTHLHVDTCRDGFRDDAARVENGEEERERRERWERWRESIKPDSRGFKTKMGFLTGARDGGSGRKKLTVSRPQ